MAIQFHCVACAKPIEIDDEWAGRLVECPYCHETITAPAFSMSSSPGRARELRPADAADSGGVVMRPPLAEAPVVQAAPQRNRLGVLALVVASVGVLLGGVACMGAAATMVQQLGPQLTPEQVNAFMEEAMKTSAPWFVKFSLAATASFGLWVVGVVCGLIAVLREPRRAAVAALVVSALPLVFMVIGLAVRGG